MLRVNAGSPATQHAMSSDVHYAVKLIAARMGVTQRLLTDLLMLQGIVPYLKKLGESDELWKDGAQDLAEHLQLLEYKVRAAQKKEARG